MEKIKIVKIFILAADAIIFLDEFILWIRMTAGSDVVDQRVAMLDRSAIYEVILLASAATWAIIDTNLWQKTIIVSTLILLSCLTHYWYYTFMPW